MSESKKKTQPMRLDCPKLKVAVRSAPSAQGAVTHFLQSGTVVEVKVKESKGFYELADGSVNSFLSYFVMPQFVYNYQFGIIYN